jgi:hypothetical protein
MKQKDLALVGVIIIVSAIVSLFISKSIFNTSKNQQQQVVSVQSISPNFPPLPKQYFNSSSIDPTQIISINQNSNQNPFANTEQ